MAAEFLAAMIGTVAFSVLFSVPRFYYIYCGIIGAAGWIIYSVCSGFFGPAEACLMATIVVILLSRFAAIWKRCPVTVFLIAGIFPLVPGAGIYWTAYYLVTDQLHLALQTGYGAVKSAVAIVLGIVFVFELPQKWFLTVLNIRKKDCRSAER